MNTPEKKNYKYKPSPEEIFHFIQNNLMTEAYDFYKVGKFIKILPAPDRIEMPPGEILNRIKELLDDKRIKEIEGLDRDKPILIIGKDTNKVDLIVSYIHLTHPTVQRKDKFDMFEVERLKRGYVGRIRFSSIDYTGRNELYIENDLFVTRKFKDSFGGVMLFLRGISGECKGIFEHIASVMRDKKYDYGKKVVIISTDNLQQKPSEGFEVIKLEPGKQSEAGDIPQDAPKTEASGALNETVFFDNEKGYLWLSSGKKEKLEPEDAKIFEIVIEIFNSGQLNCRIEQIIEILCGKTIGFQQKITNNSTYKKCKSAFSTINAKFRKLLNTNDKKIKLIKSGQRNIVLLKKCIPRTIPKSALKGLILLNF